MYYPVRTYNSFQIPKVDHLSIGSSPSNEDEKLQAGDDPRTFKRQCTTYIEQLIRKYGEPPQNASFFILENHHDFGIYYEAAIRFSTEDEAATDYAFKVEGGDRSWDKQSKAEIKKFDSHDKVEQP